LVRVQQRRIVDREMRVPHDEIGFHDAAGRSDNIDELRLFQASRCSRQNSRCAHDAAAKAKSGKPTEKLGTRE
jgi:hypothetical protein